MIFYYLDSMGGWWVFGVMLIIKEVFGEGVVIVKLCPY
jgi:hypothetical protein